MKVIEQEEFFNIESKVNEISGLRIEQSGRGGSDSIWIDKKGAKQLIEILKEFVGEDG